LDPSATWQAAQSLIVPCAIFLATLRIGNRGRRSLSLIFVAGAAASVFLGLAQLAQGDASGLRFYPITNAADSVGFFANRNHYAALLYTAIPFAAVWLIALLHGRLRDRWLPVAALVLTYVLLIVGLAMARSRAGVFLALAMAIASALLAAFDRGGVAKRSLAVVAIALVVGLAVAFQYAFFGLLGRLDDDVLADFRLTIDGITVNAAHAFLPVGSGFGTFVPVYQMFETPNALISAYINHAHNDWLETWLEGGWTSIAIAGAFVVWFVAATWRVWRGEMPGAAPIDQNLARAASVVIAGLLLHSLVDYPLRTTALMTLFAFAAGLLIQPIVVPEHTQSVAGPTRHWLAQRLRARRRVRGSRGWREAGAA
jgi:O-antigen ligase